MSPRRKRVISTDEIQFNYKPAKILLTEKEGSQPNGQTPNIIGICWYCVLDRPVFEWNQVLLHPELTPWWSFLFADGAHHKKPYSPTLSFLPMVPTTRNLTAPPTPSKLLRCDRRCKYIYDKLNVWFFIFFSVDALEDSITICRIMTEPIARLRVADVLSNMKNIELSGAESFNPVSYVDMHYRFNCFVVSSLNPLTHKPWRVLTHWGRVKMAAIFKWIFLNETVWISINISLKFVPWGPINNITTLVQVMAWRRPGDKPLSEPMMVRLPTHICVTRPQWVIKIEAKCW